LFGNVQILGARAVLNVKRSRGVLFRAREQLPMLVFRGQLQLPKQKFNHDKNDETRKINMMKKFN
jgi:hypothetical protein